MKNLTANIAVDSGTHCQLTRQKIKSKQVVMNQAIADNRVYLAAQIDRHLKHSDLA